MAFLLGAISPDIFFYDLPFFSLSRLGDRLHALMEREGLNPIQRWMTAEKRSAPDAVAWGLGFASHFLADAIWHPIINDLSNSIPTCGGMRLRGPDRHRLIESEMEAFWLPKKSTPQRYVSLLKEFGANRKRIAHVSDIYHGFLDFNSLEPSPSRDGIYKCYIKQNLMLRIFTAPPLARRRDILLRRRFGRYLGSLVVPLRPFMHLELPSRVPANRDPFSDALMNSGFTSLETQLSDFARRLAPSLPS